MNILLADSDLNLVDIATKALRKEGHTVCSTIDCNRALDRAETDHPDLLILDSNIRGTRCMRAKCGMQIAAILGDEEETRDIPVLFLSDDADRRTMAELMALTNTVGVIVKPFSMSHLVERVAASMQTIELNEHKSPHAISRRVKQALSMRKRRHVLHSWSR